MVSVHEATQIIQSVTARNTTEEVSIGNCMGRVLAEQIVADRDFPPFNRVAMDGIAINSCVFQSGKPDFKIEAIQPAGAPMTKLVNEANAIEVMTGAMLPRGTDAVIRYEDLIISGGVAKATLPEVKAGMNIHPKAQDARQGEVLLHPGQLLSPAEVALLAAVGKGTVKVKTFPATAVVSSGDELVEINDTPELHQVRRSNAYALLAAMRQHHWHADQFHLMDTEEKVKSGLVEILNNYDVLILSGGVSKGKYDFVPGSLNALGVEKKFHHVSQRPGKPFWFGCRDDGKVVFALPGNPVSTYVCFYKYILPWMMEQLGVTIREHSAILSEDFLFAPALTCFLQVSTYYKDGKLFAKPVPGGGSGDFVNLKGVDGFLELPAEKSVFGSGEVFPYIPFRHF